MELGRRGEISPCPPVLLSESRVQERLLQQLCHQKEVYIYLHMLAGFLLLWFRFFKINLDCKQSVAVGSGQGRILKFHLPLFIKSTDLFFFPLSATDSAPVAFPLTATVSLGLQSFTY